MFQLESTGMREAYGKWNQIDLMILALVALYRPGPSNIPIYNDCKNGNRKPDYIHETIKDILSPTYGIIIYQNNDANRPKLAGFTAGEADILRRARVKEKDWTWKEKKGLYGAQITILKDEANMLLK